MSPLTLPFHFSSLLLLTGAVTSSVSFYVSSPLPWNGYEAKLFQVEFSLPTRWGRRATSQCLTRSRTLMALGWAASCSCPRSVARCSGLLGSSPLSVSLTSFLVFSLWTVPENSSPSPSRSVWNSMKNESEGILIYISVSCISFCFSYQAWVKQNISSIFCVILGSRQ